MNPTRPDVVYDGNVFLQAIARSQGPAAEALRIVEQNWVTLYISKPILREMRRTLSYPELRQKNPQLTDEVIDAFIAELRRRGAPDGSFVGLFTPKAGFYEKLGFRQTAG